MTVTITYNEKLWAHKDTVKKIVFESIETPRENATYTYDLSSAQDESVICYLYPDTEDNTKYIAYIQSENRIKANSNSSWLFYNFTNLEQIENLDYLDTSNVTNMASMFSECRNLTTTINIRGTKCVNYTYMFGNAFTTSSQITVNYTSDASSLVEQMLATKSSTSNVVKGSVIS